MIIILISFIATLAITGIILYMAKRHKQLRAEKMGLTIEEEAPEIPDECCGQHQVCEKESLLAAVSQGIEYYDDEELDRYRGTPSCQYDEEQCSQFRDVLYTMQSHEVAGWVRSLQLRGIELPDEVKDEVLLIVGERRTQA